MKRIHHTASLAMAALTLATLAGAAFAGEQVPFKGNVEGTYTRTGTFPFFHLEPTGTGQASQLGNFAFSIPHDVNLLLIPPGGTGTFEFTGANGDSVFGTFDTSATPTEIPGVIAGVEYMVINGGTGRFEGASGSFLCERLVDTINLTTTGSFNGTISSPGANKP